MEKNVLLREYLLDTRLRFCRLLAILKWLKGAPDLQREHKVLEMCRRQEQGLERLVKTSCFDTRIRFARFQYAFCS